MQRSRADAIPSETSQAAAPDPPGIDLNEILAAQQSSTGLARTRKTKKIAKKGKEDETSLVQLASAFPSAAKKCNAVPEHSSPEPIRRLNGCALGQALTISVGAACTAASAACGSAVRAVSMNSLEGVGRHRNGAESSCLCSKTFSGGRFPGRFPKMRESSS